MGYFDGLAAAPFKKDKDGNTVFYPHGIFGRGRVIADPVRAEELRKFLRTWYQVMMVVVIVPCAIRAWILLLIAMPPLALWWYIRSRSLLAGCPYSEDRLNVGESARNSAAGHSRSTLWLLLAGSALFVVGGVAIAATAKSGQDLAVGLGSAVFFGACGAVFVYMLKVKR